MPGSFQNQAGVNGGTAELGVISHHGEPEIIVRVRTGLGNKCAAECGDGIELVDGGNVRPGIIDIKLIIIAGQSGSAGLGFAVEAREVLSAYNLSGISINSHGTD